MFNTAIRITRHSAQAEDVMQEAFLKAFLKIDSFESNSTFGAWLKRIVVNESIKAYRNNKKRAEVSYNDELKNKICEDGISSNSKKSEKANEILEQLNSLKDNYRVGLSLLYIEGYDYEEICEIMNISYGNCRTMISRAKEKLRTKLKDNGR